MTMTKRSWCLRVFAASTFVIALAPAPRLRGQRPRFFSEEDDTRTGVAAARPAGAPRSRVAAAYPIDRSDQDTTTPRADDGSIIDLFVAYTPAARAAAGSTAAVTSLIALGVSETNQAYATNGLPARLRLVGTYEWNTTES